MASTDEKYKTSSKNQGERCGSSILTNTMMAAQPNSNISTAEMKYDMGSGDLCFGRWCERSRRISKKFDSLSEEEYWSVGSHGNIITELNNYERIGSFPFFKLPTEIRFKIYRMLLEPLYKESSIEIDVDPRLFSIRHSHEIQNYGGTFDDFLEYQNSLDEIARRFRTPQTETQNQKTIASNPKELHAQKILFQLEKKTFSHRALCNPSRTSDYELSCSVYRNFEGSRIYDDPKYFEWLRQAGCVNRAFRTELRKLLWTNVTISSIDECPLDIYSDFMMDVPIAIQGIKKFDLLVYWAEDISSEQFAEKQGQYFKRLCIHLKKLPNLESLSFHATVEERFLHTICLGLEPFQFLRECRKIPVTDNFSASLSVTDIEMDHVDPSRWDQYFTELEKKYDPLLTELMMPQSLKLKSTELEV